MDKADYNESIKDKIGRARTTLFTLLIFPAIICAHLFDQFNQTERLALVSKIEAIEFKINRANRDLKSYIAHVTSNQNNSSTEQICIITSSRTDSIKDLMAKEQQCHRFLRNFEKPPQIRTEEVALDLNELVSLERELYQRSFDSLDALASHLRGLQWKLPKYELSKWDPIAKLVETTAAQQKQPISIAGITMPHSFGLLALPIIIIVVQIYLLSIASEIRARINIGCEISSGFIFFHHGSFGVGLGIIWVWIPPVTFIATYCLQISDILNQISLTMITFSAAISSLTTYKFLISRKRVLSPPLKFGR